MIITNTRTIHTVINESASMKLQGEVQFNAEGAITSFNGQFYKLPNEEGVDFGEFAGDFWFAENEDGTVSKSVTSIPNGKMSECCDFLEATVSELHEFNKPEEQA